MTHWLTAFSYSTRVTGQSHKKYFIVSLRKKRHVHEMFIRVMCKPFKKKKARVNGYIPTSSLNVYFILLKI